MHAPISRSVKFSFGGVSGMGYYLIVFYILLSPLSMLLPPIRLGIEINLYRITVIGLFVVLLIRIALSRKEKLHNKFMKYIIAALCAYGFSLLINLDNDMILHLKSSFSLLTFFIVLLFLMVTDKIPPFRFWALIIVLSSCIAFMFGVAMLLNVIPIPTYRYEVENYFTDSRTANIIDTSIGLWGMISSIYLLSTMRKLCWIVLGYLGLSMSLGLILISGFRIILFVATMIFLSNFVILTNRNTIKLLVLFATGILIVWTISGNQLLTLPGIERTRSWLNGESDGSVALYYRYIEYNIEVDLIKNKPILGYGWSVGDIYSVPLLKGGEIPLSGHCLYTAIPVRVGIPIFIIIMSVFFITFKQGISLIFRQYKKNSNPEIVAAVQGLGAFFIVSLTQNLLLMTATTGILSIYAAYILRAEPQNNLRRLSTLQPALQQTSVGDKN